MKEEEFSNVNKTNMLCQLLHKELDDINKIQEISYKKPIIVSSKPNLILKEYQNTIHSILTEHSLSDKKIDIKMLTNVTIVEGKSGNVLLIPFILFRLDRLKCEVPIGFITIHKNRKKCLQYAQENNKTKEYNDLHFFLKILLKETGKRAIPIVPFGFKDLDSCELVSLQTLLRSFFYRI